MLEMSEESEFLFYLLDFQQYLEPFLFVPTAGQVQLVTESFVLPLKRFDIPRVPCPSLLNKLIETNPAEYVKAFG